MATPDPANRPSSPEPAPPPKTSGRPRPKLSLVENVLFVLVTALCFAFAIVLLIRAEGVFAEIGYLLLFWVVMAYLALPRFHRTMASIYVPDYFIGRTRTVEGLLGDPVNLAYNGTQAQVHAAMTAAGWTLAEPVTLHSSMKIVCSTLRRMSYPSAPVSPLQIFGRTQTLAYQKQVQGNPAQRHHIRLWETPPGWMLPGGHRVDWVAAGTYDRAVGLSIFTFQVTHKIDENVDVERDFVIDSVCEAVPEAGVDVIENFSTGYHARNGGGDAIYTDGNLPIVQLEEVDPADYEEAAAEHAGVLPGETGEVDRTRPLSIVFATAFIALTIVSAGLAIVSRWDEIRAQVASWLGDIEASALPVAMPVVAVVLVVYYAVVAWLAVKLYCGSEWARFALLFLVMATQFSHIAAFIGGVDSSAGAALIAAWGLLALYALTSVSAREWSQRAELLRAAEGTDT